MEVQDIDVGMNYGIKIKQIRQMWGLNQEKFAEKTGFSPQAISQYENNIATPNLTFMKNLIFNLNVNPLWFFMDQGDAIIDTQFQLGDDFEDLMEHFKGSFALQQLFTQAMALKREDEEGKENKEYFYQWHGLVNGMKDILMGMKTERQKNVEKQRQKPAGRGEEKG